MAFLSAGNKGVDRIASLLGVLLVLLLFGACGSMEEREPRVCPPGESGCVCILDEEALEEGADEEDSGGTCRAGLDCIDGRCRDVGRGLSPVIELLRLLPNQVPVEGSFSLFWSARDVSDCDIGAATLGIEEAGLPRQGTMTFSLSEEVSVGSHTIELSCSYRNRRAIRAVTLTVRSDGEGPRITRFSLNEKENPFALQKGEPLELRWATREVEVCVGGGNFPGWSGLQSLEGTLILETEAIAAGVYTLTLQCTDGERDTPEVVRTVVVQSEEMDCSDRLPPQGWSPEYGIVDGTSYPGLASWDELFGAPFPEGSQDRSLFTESNRFVAIEFEVPDDFEGVVQIGHQALEESGISTGPKIWTVSSCPGDFSTPLFSRCRQMDPTSTGIRFGTETSAAFTPFHCPIMAGKRYFWNVHWGDRNDGRSQWGCGEGQNRCGDRIRPWITLD